MKAPDKINTRQLCIFYAIYSLSIKILALPSILAAGAANFAWAAALIGIAFEILTVMLATWLLRIDTKSVFAKILYCLFVPILLLELWLTGTVTHGLVYENLFADLPLIVFIATLAVIGAFFIYRPMRAFFRSGEILWLFILIGIIMAVIPTVYDLDKDFAVLVSGSGSGIVKTAAFNVLYFQTAIFVFIFGASSERNSKDIMKINLTAVFTGLFFAAFVALFIVLFGPLAVNKTTAIIDMTTASKHITDSGAFDWYIASAALTMLVLRLGAEVAAVVICVKKIFNLRKKAVA